jgi:hypothetical protein
LNYQEFLKSKAQCDVKHGFEPIWIPDTLIDFQKYLVEWAIRKGRGALFEDCGTGKTFQQLVWAENVVRYTNKRVIIGTPIAVSHQTVKEGEKFGIECYRSSDGKPKGKITVTNYERLHLFDPNDYIGMVADESSILKNFDGKRKAIITEFMRTLPYRLLCTATASPNDYIELGTSSEALGELGYMDMLGKFFKNDLSSADTRLFHGKKQEWRFKKHAITAFWKWVCSWSRAMRMPSDIGFDDGDFILPELIENEVVIDNTKPLPGELFVRPAFGLREQREEQRMTLTERCEKVAGLMENGNYAVCWCNLNDEGDLLEKLIPDAVQVSGKDNDDKKEEKLKAFTDGEIKKLVTKAKITGFGLNWQHCNHTTVFPSHSFEQYYQLVRRFWRFGQKKSVKVDIITTGGGLSVLKNLKKKADKADIMFQNLIKYMNEAQRVKIDNNYDKKVEVPNWVI